MLGNVIACLIVLFIVIKACSPSGGTSKKQVEAPAEEEFWTLPRGTPVCSTEELYSTQIKLISAHNTEMLDGCTIVDSDHDIVLIETNVYSPTKIMVVDKKLVLWTDFSFLTSEKRAITKPKPKASPAKAIADLDTGIKPSAICNILSSKGIKTGEWKTVNNDGDEWHCTSSYIDIGEGIDGGMPNNIAYYVNGSEKYVSQALLVLNINNPNEESAAIQKLLNTSITLTDKITKLPLSPALQNAIKNGAAGKEELFEFKLSVTRENWKSGSGYGIHFLITPRPKAVIKRKLQQQNGGFDSLLALANTGDAAAQNKLANAYYNGEGTPKNLDAAFKLYTSAAKQGLPNAQFNLGAMYFEGEGTAKNNKKALEWLQKAAAQGVTESQYYLDKIKDSQ